MSSETWMEIAADTNLRNIGEKRLLKRSEEDLKLLFEKMLPKTTCPSEKEAIVKDLLSEKERRKREKAEGGGGDGSTDEDCKGEEEAAPFHKTKRVVIDGETHELVTAQPIVSSLPLPPAPPPPASEAILEMVKSSKEAVPLPVKNPQVAISFFNSNKLFRQGATVHHLSAFHSLGAHDVVFVSEVPNTPELRDWIKGIKRLLTFEMTEKGEAVDPLTDVDSVWQCVCSELGQGVLKERHLAFLRIASVTLTGHTTTHSSDKGNFDYSPLTISFTSKGFPGHTFVASSVHFPPGTNSDRRSKRDAEIKAFLQSYTQLSEMRISVPFTEKAAKDASKDNGIHIVGGDFNVYPGLKEYELEKNGWAQPIIGSKVATSAGRKNYDNILVDAETSQRFLVQPGVLELPSFRNPSTGEIGASDHSPVFCILQSVTGVK